MQVIIKFSICNAERVTLLVSILLCVELTRQDPVSQQEECSVTVLTHETIDDTDVCSYQLVEKQRCQSRIRICNSQNGIYAKIFSLGFR